MNEYEKEELKKELQEKLDKVTEKSEFDVSMGDAELSIKFADGFAEDLINMASRTPEEEEEEQRKYEMRIYDTVRKSIDTKGEIVVYSTGYNLNDYITEDGQLSYEAYWEIHKDAYEKDMTFEKFLEQGEFEKLIIKNGVSMWDDVMIIDDHGEEHTLVTIMTSEYCKLTYDEELERAVKDKDSEYEKYLKEEGIYESCLHDDFNDIIVKAKKFKSLSHEDITRAIRWFIKHRLKITDKYNIRYATFEEKEGGRKDFIDMITSRLKDTGIDRDESQYTEKNQREFFKKHNLRWYYGTYLHKNSE